MKCIDKWLIIAAISMVALSSCHKNRIDIMLPSVEIACNTSLFQGARPDITYESLVSMCGVPDDFLDLGEDGGTESPTYYKNEGKIICHSSYGDVQIGMVEYVPYNSVTMHINDFMPGAVSEYGITNETETVRLYQNDTLYYLIELDDCDIVRVEYWLSKKRFLNVAY